MRAERTHGTELTGIAELATSELAQIGDPTAANAVAISRAVKDAGLGLDDLDAVFTYDSLVQPHPMQATRVCEYLGLMPRFASTIGAGGASPLFAVVLAAALVDSGQARAVAVAHSDFRRSTSTRTAVIEQMATMVGNAEFDAPLGPVIPTLYALLADRLTSQGAVDRDDLADIAVQTRHWAALNPNARKTETITTADVLSAPRIAGVLGLLDCCLVTDFSGAVIVGGHDSQSRHRRVRLAGSSGAVSHEELAQGPYDPLTPLSSTAEDIYRHTGISPADLDAAFLYDSFTITVAAQILAYGLDQGRGVKKFLRDDGIGPGGAFPINTHGGLLSASTSGMFHLIEAVRQIRGEAGYRQLDRANTVLVTGIGGVLSHSCAAILTGASLGD
jgi:acetyl-CoA acetyltransferase